MSDEDQMSANGPLSWRDVYRAVGESEGRIVAQISELRSTVISDLKGLDTRVSALETINVATAARNAGAVAVLSTGQKVAIGLAGLIGAAGGAIAILDRLRL